MRYTHVKYLAFFILGLYFYIAIFITGGNDMYPVFSWQLFSFIPNEKNDYTIEVLRYGNEVYDPPLRFSETSFIFDEISVSPTEYTPLIRKLGSAVENGRTQEAKILETKIEQVFRDKRYSYNLLRVHFDPVKYWRSRTYETKEFLGTYNNTGSP